MTSDEFAHAWLKKHKFNLEDVCRLRRRSRNEVSSHAERTHPMLIACEFGDQAICEWLLDHGASSMLSAKSSYHWTPMMRASSKGFVHICEWLLENGAEKSDISTPGMSGYYCMHWAAKSGNRKCCQWLYEHGGKSTIQVQNDAGWRPLRIAAQHGHVEVCVWLISVGALEVGGKPITSLPLLNDVPFEIKRQSGPSIPKMSQHLRRSIEINKTSFSSIISNESKFIRSRILKIMKLYLQRHDVFMIGVVGGASRGPLGSIAGSSAPYVIGAYLYDLNSLPHILRRFRSFCQLVGDSEPQQSRSQLPPSSQTTSENISTNDNNVHNEEENRTKNRNEARSSGSGFDSILVVKEEEEALAEEAQVTAPVEASVTAPEEVPVEAPRDGLFLPVTTIVVPVFAVSVLWFCCRTSK